MRVHADQLAFDLEGLVRLVEQIRDRRRVQAGAPRLLAELVRAGLAQDALIPAAALVLELDRPPEAPA